MLMGCEPNAPAFKKVVTGDATNITDYSAQLPGTLNVNPNGYGHLYYGIVIAQSQAEIKNHKGKYYESTSLNGQEFVVNVYGLTPNTHYYYCTWVAMNQKEQKYFGKIKAFTTLDGTGIPEGEEHPNTNYVAKPFSVSSNRQVYFSPGNLQYRPNATTWRFAPQQTDYIGSANRNTALTYDSWIDLFGWSTHEGYSYFGVSTDTAANYYEGRFQDWGCKRIGKDEANTWRTLTYDEWWYVLTARKNCNQLMGCAMIMGVNGLILLPDDWQCPEGVVFKPGFYDNDDKAGYGAHMNLDQNQWQAMEHAGAIFLPAAGYRAGLDVGNYQYEGFYWSATANEKNTAYYAFFSAGMAEPRTRERYHAHSVRLVKDK
jgi:hypothetical protein